MGEWWKAGKIRRSLARHSCEPPDAPPNLPMRYASLPEGPEAERRCLPIIGTQFVKALWTCSVRFLRRGIRIMAALWPYLTSA